MSFCPQRLLRSRFSAGLPSWDPHHRWYQPGTGIRGSRASYSSNDASNTRSQLPPAVDTAIIRTTTPYTIPEDPGRKNVLRRLSSTTSTVDKSSSHESPSRVYSIESQSSTVLEGPSPSAEQELVAPNQDGRYTGRRPRFLSSKRLLSIPGRSSIFASGPAPAIIYKTKVMVRGQPRDRQRVLRPKTVALEKRIRSQTFFHEGANIRTWRIAQSDLYRSKFYGREIRNDFLRDLKLNTVELDLLEKLKTDSQGSFRETWEALSKRDKALHWHSLSLWLLKESPELALEFLAVTTHGKERPVFVMVADAFLFLDSFYYHRLKDWRKGPHTYQSVFNAALGPRNWPILFLPQKIVRLYVKRADRDAIYYAYKLVCERKIHTKAETHLCFMWRFIEFKDVNKALDVLDNVRRMKQVEFEMDSQSVMRHCCKLLTLDSVQEGPEGRNFYILPKLLKMGVRPDRDMMNVVLSNAFKTGDEQLGLDMLEYMKNNGLEPDSYTHLILLNDAVARGNRDRVSSLIREIESNEELLKNPWISSKIFHAHFVFTAKHINPDDDPDAVFYSMLEMYNKLHDITPLKELSILPPEYTPPPGGDNTPPTTIALFLMIATYLRCRRRVSIAQRLYTNFRSLVLQGHPTIAPLAATDHVYNEFLVAFRDNPRGLRPAMRVVEDMLQTSALTSNTRGMREQTSSHVMPSVRTWTILMSCFIFNKQPHAAERVKEMMAEHNVEFNKVTWNIIISGHACKQRVFDLAQTIKAMEDAGYVIDSYNMKALRYLRDPERLWVALEELDKLSQPSLATLADTKLAPPKSDKKTRDELLDRGLQRLREKLKPKL
ncbi:hypothetical protein KXW33_004012 [Aspergillus fumigatus]|nr:hypothetical protein KXW33_004012 [Aspergillus fumigatus]